MASLLASLLAYELVFVLAFALAFALAYEYTHLIWQGRKGVNSEQMKKLTQAVHMTQQLCLQLGESVGDNVGLSEGDFVGCSVGDFDGVLVFMNYESNKL